LPFKGLASFGVADSGFFFGREAEVAELVAKLAGSTFLGVVAPSGSGKSSVIRAGLVPAIADGVLPGSDGWAIAIVRPGRTPSTDTRMALTSAIGRIGGGSPEGLSVESLLAGVPEASRVMLVVDQFEELFTICEDVAERTEFVRDLVGLARDPATRALVVLAIRADFYGRCAAYRELTELLGENHVLLGPMTAEGLARAIELPARAAGLRVEPELTSALVTDLLDAPGGLPLLSTTLLELWQRRDGRALTLQTYEAIGGVSGAVSRLAEATFVRLTPRQQAIARAIFLRLAAPDVQDVITSRPVPLSDFDVDRNRDLLGVLAVLINDRLLSVSEGSVEVAHEVLMREWPRLRQWLEADADGRRVREHLSRAADEWKEAAGDPAELYRGARLAAAEEWAAEHALDLNATERAFLDQSRVDAKREGDRQRRSNRRLRALLAGAATLLVVAVVAGGFAAVQLGRAGEQARIAHARELYASAIAVVDEDPNSAFC
jgi:hypothetical protein